MVVASGGGHTIEAAFCLPHLTIWFLDGRALKTPNYCWYSEVLLLSRASGKTLC